ncbi:MAG: MFS transporter [Actinobacteria bacterium]|nr:MFS transporter [Actinomycetota bacterium]
MRRAPWLSRTLLILTAVSLCQDIASELLYPLLPILLTTVFAAPPVVIGVIEGAAEGAAGLAKLVAGRVSDRWGRKPVTTAGYALAAAGKVIVAASGSWLVVMAGRVTDRLGKGTRAAARDAWLADGVEPRFLGRAFGFHRMGDSIGAVLGPLVGIAVLAATDDIRVALWVAVVPAVASALLVLVARETRSGQESHQSGSRTPAAATPPQPAASPIGRGAVEQQLSTHDAPRVLGARFWRVCAPLTAIALVNFPDALLLLRLHDLGWSTQSTLAGYVVFNLVYSIAALPAGAVTDRLGPHIAYGVAMVAFAAAYGGLGLIAGGHDDWRAWALLCAYGLFPAFSDGVGKAWISRTVADDVRGWAQGVFQSMGNAAVLIAGVWAGLLWNVGPGHGVVPLSVAAVGGAIAAVVLLGAGMRRSRLGSH